MQEKAVAILIVCSVIASTYTATVLDPKGMNDPFDVWIECSKQYQLGEDVICQVHITNMHEMDYYLLKRDTPLDNDMSSARALSVTRNGKELNYDGWIVHREDPSLNGYTLVKAGATVTARVDLSNAYAMRLTGKYQVQLHKKVQYFAATKNILSTTLHSPSSSFKLTGPGLAKLTVGQFNRQKSKLTQSVIALDQCQIGQPLEPNVVGASSDEEVLIREIHRAAYLYITTGITDIEDNLPHYVKWFGEYDANRFNDVKFFLQKMKSTLESDIYTYDFFGTGCDAYTNAYTYQQSREVYFCPKFNNKDNVLGERTKLSTVVHELRHTVATDDVEEVYGRQNGLDLAVNDPAHAVANAASYGYFVETMNVFDYGHDSMTVWSDGRTYVTRGNLYIRYVDDSKYEIDDGYPQLIRGDWGSINDDFNAGFDSMISFGDDHYVTKGSQYVHYSGNSLQGDADPLQGDWGSLTDTFAAGFDSMEKWNNGRTYITKGYEYIRSSDDGYTVDSGYPLELRDSWGELLDRFADGFDSMALLGNGKVYVTKGKEYIRYSERGTVDPGYPKPIKGNWGSLHIPGPH